MGNVIHMHYHSKESKHITYNGVSIDILKDSLYKKIMNHLRNPLDYFESSVWNDAHCYVENAISNRNESVYLIDYGTYKVPHIMWTAQEVQAFYNKALEALLK